MPRILKRRANDISRSRNEDEDTPDDESPQPSRRPRNNSPQNEEANSDLDAFEEEDTETQTQKTTQVLVKKLVRLALSTEYSRTPLRRADINAKVLKDTNGSARNFKTIFAGAQQVLQDVFGMQLVELPSREKTGLNERRKAATQTQSFTQTNRGNDGKSQSQGGTLGKSASAQSYILTSTLPAPYKTQPTILHPIKTSTAENEAIYTSLYTFLLSLIYLNGGSIPEAKMERHLRRVGMEQWTPLGLTLDKLLQRMTKEGYVEKRRDTSGGEEVIEWLAGPRGKVEVGVKGVAGLVRSVYGFGAVPLAAEAEDDEENEGQQETQLRRPVKMEADELERRLKRSLGESVANDSAGVVDEGHNGGGQDTQANGSVSVNENQAPNRRTRARRRNVNDDDDDE